MKGHKCIVYGCKNHEGEGGFVGDLCSPCYTMLSTGVVHSNTDSFLAELNDYREFARFVATDYIELSYEKAQWQRDDWRKRAKKVWYNEEKDR